MTDPLGLINNLGGAANPQRSIQRNAAPETGQFKTLLEDQIRQVNELQRDAKEAIEDLHAGRRDDVESVMLATVKADTAFRMLLQIRNKVMDAYEEIKQVRV